MKKRLLLTFPANRVEAPVVYHLVKDYDVKVNILNADITPGREGKLLVELRAPAESLDRAEEYMNNLNIRISPAMKSIILREDDCVHCGSCTAVCFSDALIMDTIKRELIFSPDKCISCELCIKACPLNLFSLNFS